MRFWLTVLAVLAILGVAVRIGRGPERYTAGILITSFLLTLANRTLRGPFGFDHVDPVLATIDGLTLVATTWVALRANRLWPLVVSSFQWLIVFAHVSVLITPYLAERAATMINQGYWAMMIVSNYAQLILISLGTLTHYLRERRIGRYRSWRAGGMFPWAHVPLPSVA